MMYYLSVNGSPVGPMTPHQMMAYNVNPQSTVSTDGVTWSPLYTHPELMEAYRNYERYNSTAMQSGINSKRVLCGICAILFGTLGVQYFIMGKIGGGFLTILLSVVTCGIWGVITLIQGIMMLTMSDAEFEAKYLNSTSTMPLF